MTIEHKERIAELETLILGLQNSNGHLKYRIAELEAQNANLLEALKGCVKVMEPHMERDGYLVIRVGLARAAIAAVEGKP